MSRGCFSGRGGRPPFLADGYSSQKTDVPKIRIKFGKDITEVEIFECKVTNENKFIVKAQRVDDSCTEVIDTVEIFQEKIRKPYDFDVADRTSADEGSCGF